MPFAMILSSGVSLLVNGRRLRRWHFVGFRAVVYGVPVPCYPSKVTVKDTRYTGILMGTVQAGIANGVDLRTKMFLAGANLAAKGLFNALLSLNPVQLENRSS